MSTVATSKSIDDARRVDRADLVRALVSMAPLFEYPTANLSADVFSCRRQLASRWPEAAELLTPFLMWTLNEPADVLEERYTRTFDISAVCAPYAGVHIFGEESFARGELMARLRDSFDMLGFDAGVELPDHIAILLRFAGILDDESFDELVEYCLTRFVSTMAKRFAPLENPYREPTSALNLVVGDAATHGGRP